MSFRMKINSGIIFVSDNSFTGEAGDVTVKEVSAGMIVKGIGFTVSEKFHLLTLVLKTFRRESYLR